jgi:uncharacterized protein YhjY with autotransporter beta-barrel domain
MFHSRMRIYLFGSSLLAISALSATPVLAEAPDIVDVPIIINNDAIGTISQTVPGYLLVDNRPGGTIGEIQLAPQSGAPSSGPVGVYIINAGTIESTLLLRGGANPLYFVNAGGRVAGDLRMADPNDISSLTFINRADQSGVDGSIDAGLGFDRYIKSFANSGSYDLGTVLPTSFEIGGVEALGTNTVVTLTSANNASVSGLGLLGNGSIVNAGNIAPVLLESAFLPEPLRLAAVAYGGEVGKTAQLIGPFSEIIPYGSALTGFTNNGTIDGDIRLATASFVNTGHIGLRSADQGSIIRSAADSDFAFVNSGSITMIDSGPRNPVLGFGLPRQAISIFGAIDSTVAKPVSIANSGEIVGGLSAALAASSFTFDNSGTISSIPGQQNEAVQLSIGGTPFALEEGINEFTAGTATIANSGSIEGGFYGFFASNETSFVNSGHIGATEGRHAVILATQFNSEDQPPVDSAQLSFANSGDIGGTVIVESDATSLAVTNTGTITADVSGYASLFPIVIPAFEIEYETIGSNVLSFENRGSISTAEYGSPAILLNSAAGTSDDDWDIDLTLPPVDGGATAQVSVVNSGSIVSTGGQFVTPGSLVGQPGKNFLTPSVGLAVLAEGVGATSIVIDNRQSGIISALGAPHFGTPDGVMSPLNPPANSAGIAIAASADTVTIRNDGHIIGSPAALFDPDHIIYNPPEGFDSDGVRGGAIDTVNSQDVVVNGATGSIVGGIALRGGDDRIANYGVINGDIYLGDGDDRFIQGIAATLTGTADGGAGTDSALFDITGGGTLNDTLVGQLVNFESFGLTGSGEIQFDGPLQMQTLVLADGELRIGSETLLETLGDTAVSGGDGDEGVVNRGAIGGGIALAGGADGVENHGTIGGDVDLGDGADQFIFYHGSAVNGVIDGAAGNDRLRLHLGGGLFDFASYRNFEGLDIEEGTGSYDQSLTFDVVNINGGRLIGLTGSTITANGFNVATGGTFGSAGTVNGDVNVMGTLSPGASPGTMTINGDVSLATGSNTLFEMTPTVSDAIVINGSLAIATGATLTLTGERPLTPGLAYDLIVADDGITGSFTTINKAAAVAGFVRQGVDRIQLLGQFQLQPGATGQVSATIGYLNGLLIGGTATTGLIDAVPGLLTATGFADPAKIGRLHPEAYASASQIGIENGLAIAAALRSTPLAHRDEASLFTFGEGFGNWRRLPGASATGTSQANIQNHGLVGGIGFGSKTASVGAFIGYIDSRQRISGLGASTDADGVVAGLIGQARLGGLELGALVARDASSADTERSLPNGASATSHYKLRGWTADVSAGYAFAIGAGWALKPEIGLTHISSRRGATSESGAGIFDLDVDGRRAKATFLSGAFTLKGDATAKVRPWLSAGLRHQIDGRGSLATASLAGVAATFTVPGVERSKTLATVGAGLGISIAPGVDLFAGANSEFGGDSSGANANAGLRLRF